MNQKIKISQLPAKGSNLAAADLLEIAEFTGTGYISKSITGQELIDAIPLPPSGITIGTTLITSGTVGRVLFEGTGNVVQESANLFWDNTNGRLGIGTSSPTAPLQITTSGLVTALYINTGNDGGFTSQNNGTLALNRTTQVRLVNGSTFFGANDRSYQLVNIGKSATASDFFIQYWDGSTYSERLRLFATGNLAINTTTDAGFRLDVNGTARVSGLNGNMTFSAVGDPSLIINSNTGTLGQLQLKGGAATSWIIGTQDNFLSNALIFRKGATTTMVHTASGNLLINTTTDAGYKLDVNGTARVKGTGNSGATSSLVCDNSDGQRYLDVKNDGNIFVKTTRSLKHEVSNGVFYFDLGNIIVRNGDSTAASTMSIGKASTADASSILDLVSTTRGFLPPRMTTTQKNAIATPATGLMVYDTTLNLISVYNGTTWITL